MYCESVLSCTHSALSKLDSTLVRTALSSFIDSVNLSLIKKKFLCKPKHCRVQIHVMLAPEKYFGS